MSQRSIPEEVMSDLNVLLEKDEILAKEFEEFVDLLTSDEVKNYLEGLSKGSKAEQALRESFLTNNSKFAQYLFQDVFPEVNQEGGFLDYLIKADREEIGLEIKPLFDGIFKKEKAGRVFQKIKKLKLNPEDHKKQILRYLEGTREFVVLTNLEDWYFFSKSYSLDKECNYFGSAKLFDLLEDFKQVDDFWYYLDKKEDLSIREPLDKKFYESLRNWVMECSKVSFNCNERKKTELIINLINRFIFIQSLDKFWVIENNYIKEEWSRIERRWSSKTKKVILSKFFKEINDYFFELYDTELFKEEKNARDLLDYINQDQKNIDLFYKNFKLILGIDYGITAKGWIPGIIQYNFRRIDEDILGKAYEAFLAEIRKERGIYYTPKYVTTYIIENTVDNIFDNLLKKLEVVINNEEFEKAVNLINDLFSTKILDPACGSGSFLIKALRGIWLNYKELNKLLEKKYNEYANFNKGLIRPKETESKFEKIIYLKKLLNFNNSRELISKIIIRHIHGIDLDRNALEIAKLNLWLEAIKLSPKDFQYDKLPEATNHILPDLEMNLCNGDSLVGLPEDFLLQYLENNHKLELKDLFNLRNDYLKDPRNIELINRITEIKKRLRKEFEKEFNIYINANSLPNIIKDFTKPFYWVLDFWFVFFDENLNIKSENIRGFDGIIGNPPYVDIKELNPEFTKYLFGVYKTTHNRINLYSIFIERSLSFLAENGIFGYIIPNSLLYNSSYSKIRGLILDKTTINKIIRLPDNVFEAKVETIIIIFRKTTNETLEKCEILVYNPIDEINIITPDNCMSHSLVDQSYWKKGNLNRFTLSYDNIAHILEKIEKDSILLGREENPICSICLGITPYDKYRGHTQEQIKNKAFHHNSKIDESCKPLLSGNSIVPYGVFWAGKKYIQYGDWLGAPREQRFFIEPRILVRQIISGDPPRIYAGYTEEELYNTQIGFNILISEDSPIQIKYLLALFNSILINFYHKEKFLDETKKTFQKILIENARKFPIKLIPIENQQKIINLVNEVINLRIISNKYRDLWKKISEKYRNTAVSLGKILSKDYLTIQKGKFDDVWILDSSIYPDINDDIITKNFERFRMFGENDNILNISGVISSKEELILKITFQTENLRELVYLDLLELFDSRKKVNSLNEIFTKSEISVIKSDNWMESGNLMEILKKYFIDWLNEKKKEDQNLNIIKIDNQLQKIINNINVNIFKFYGLTNEEIDLILDSSKVLESIKNEIIRFLEELDKRTK